MRKIKPTIRVTVSSPVFKQSVLDIIREEQSKSASKEVLKRSERFEQLKDGWVKDIKSGLEWGPSSSKKMNFKDAAQWCVSQGGRLPDVKELISLVDYDKREPAIDVAFFPDTKHDDYYWTGKTVAGYSGDAWAVYFRSGNVGYGDVDGSSYVRPVRASQ